MKKDALALILALFTLSYFASPTLAASSKAKLLTDTSSSANTAPYINAGPADDSTAATGLGVQVNGTEIMRVTASGNVGIGTTNPVSRLEINTAQVSPASVANGIRINETSGGYGVNIGAGSNYGWIQGLQGFLTTSGNNNIAIQPNGGNVGIGTTNPGSKLHIYAGRIQIDNTLATQSGIQFSAAGAEKSVLYRPESTVDLRVWGSTYGGDIMTWNTTNGRVGIGSIAPAAKLYVTSAVDHAIYGYQTGDGAAVLGQAATTSYGYAGYFTVAGGGTCTLANNATSWSCSSDRRLKKNIVTIDHALDKITKVNGVYFQWKKQKGKKRQTGVIAQNVIESFPEVVSRSNQGGYYSVEYSGLVPPLIEAVKELKAENDALRLRVEKLEERVK